jgi:hypothetical protein
MSSFWAGVAGLVGSALGRAQRQHPTADKLPESTITCIELCLQAWTASRWVGSLEEAYRELQPETALAIVQLAQRLDASTIIDNIRQHSASLFAAAQSPEGFFDLSYYYDVEDDVARPPVITPVPGGSRHDQELYDLPNTVNVVHLLNSVNVPVKDRAALVQWIQAAQTPEGRFATEERYNQLFVERHPVDEILADAADGFPIEYHHPLITGARPYNEIEETAHAVHALHLLGAQPRDVAACVAWLQHWQQPDGSFAGPHHPDMMALREDGRDPATPSDDEIQEYYRPINNLTLDDTYWALQALNDLGTQPSDVEGCRRWVLDAVRVPRPTANARGRVYQQWIVLWDRVEALYLAGGRLPDEQEWIGFAKRGRAGGILKVGRQPFRIARAQLRMDDLVATARSFHILEIMGDLEPEFLATFK